MPYKLLCNFLQTTVLLQLRYTVILSTQFIVDLRRTTASVCCATCFLALYCTWHELSIVKGSFVGVEKVLTHDCKSTNLHCTISKPSAYRQWTLTEPLTFTEPSPNFYRTITENYPSPNRQANLLPNHSPNQANRHRTESEPSPEPQANLHRTASEPSPNVHRTASKNLHRTVSEPSPNEP